jgi:hypothetical protein
MIKLILLVLCLTPLIFLTGCKPLYDNPTGVWVCEELSITLDFNEFPAIGTIVIDDITHDIICFDNFPDLSNIYFAPEDFPDENKWFIGRNDDSFYLDKDFWEMRAEMSSEEIEEMYAENIVIPLFRGEFLHVDGWFRGKLDTGSGKMTFTARRLVDGKWERKEAVYIFVFVGEAHNADAETIQALYNSAVAVAEGNGHDISRYTRIVTEGADYVAEEFAWASAGYFWGSANLNSIVDELSPNDYRGVDRVTDVINRGDTATGRESRRNYYREIIDTID